MPAVELCLLYVRHADHLPQNSMTTNAPKSAETQLAAAIGTSQSAVAAWESGSRHPGIEALEPAPAAANFTSPWTPAEDSSDEQHLAGRADVLPPTEEAPAVPPLGLGSGRELLATRLGDGVG